MSYSSASFAGYGLGGGGGGGGGDDWSEGEGDDAEISLSETLKELYEESRDFDKDIKNIVESYKNPEILKQILNNIFAHNRDTERQNKTRIERIKPQIDAIIQEYQTKLVSIKDVKELKQFFDEIDNKKQSIINALLTSVAQNMEEVDQLNYDLEKLNLIKTEMEEINRTIGITITTTPGNFITQIVHSQAHDHLRQIHSTIMTFSNFNLFTTFSQLFSDFYHGNINNYQDLFSLLQLFNSKLIANPTITIMSKINYLRLFEKWLNEYASLCVNEYAELVKNQPTPIKLMQAFFASHANTAFQSVFKNNKTLYIVKDNIITTQDISQGLTERLHEMNTAIVIVRAKIQTIISKSFTATRAHKRNTKKQGQMVDQMYSIKDINEIFYNIENDLVCRFATIDAIAGRNTINFSHSFWHSSYRDEFFHFYEQEQIKQFRDGVYDRIRELIMMSSNRQHTYDVVKSALSELAQSNIQETHKSSQLNKIISDWKSMTTETVFGGVTDPTGSRTDNSNLKKYRLNVYVEIASSDELSSNGDNYYYEVNGTDHKISVVNAFKLTIMDLSKEIWSMSGKSFAEMAQPDPIPTSSEFGGGGGGGGFGSYFGTGVEAVSSGIGYGLGAVGSGLGAISGAVMPYLPLGGGGGIPIAGSGDEPSGSSMNNDDSDGDDDNGDGDGDGTNSSRFGDIPSAINAGSGSSMVSGFGASGRRNLKQAKVEDTIPFPQPGEKSIKDYKTSKWITVPDWTPVKTTIKYIIDNKSNIGNHRSVAEQIIREYDGKDKELNNSIIELKKIFIIDFIESIPDKKMSTERKTNLKTRIQSQRQRTQAEIDRINRFVDAFFENIENEIASAKEARRIRLILELDREMGIDMSPNLFDEPRVASRRGGKPPRKTKKRRNPKKSRKLMSRRQKYSRRK